MAALSFSEEQGKWQAAFLARRHVFDRRLDHAVALARLTRLAIGVARDTRLDALVVGPFVAALHADFIVDVPDAAAAIGDVLDAVLDAALLDVAAQGDFAVLHFDRHVAGIDIVGVPQAFGDVFLDAFVAARIVLRAEAAIAAGGEARPLFAVALAIESIFVAIAGAIERFGRARGAVILRHVLRAPALAELVAIVGLGIAARGVADAVVFVVG